MKTIRFIKKIISSVILRKLRASNDSRDATPPAIRDIEKRDYAARHATRVRRVVVNVNTLLNERAWMTMLRHRGVFALRFWRTLPALHTVPQYVLTSRTPTYSAFTCTGIEIIAVQQRRATAYARAICARVYFSAGAAMP